MPKVSVIIPIYGVEKYIERCVRSLFEQTLKDVEYIFIDDCTKDCSIKILNKIIKEYESKIRNNNWKIIQEKMPENSGLPSVRKRGIELASGDYVLHCDSDDWVDCHMISEMWEMAAARNLDVVICDYYEASDDYKKVYRGLGHECSTAFMDIFKCSYSWALWNKLFKRTLYSNYIVFPKANIGEDMALTLQLLYYCNEIGYIEKPMYYYFKNPCSMTQTKTEEQMISYMLQWKANVSILDNFFKHNADKRISDVLILIKYMVKNSIFPILDNRRYLRVWKETFSEINISVFFSPYICKSAKLDFLLTYLGFYSKKNVFKV